MSFCTRQLELSATYTSFSEGHASWCAPENCFSWRPDFPITPSTLPSSVTLNTRPGQVLSPTNITWFGPGVMQTAFGAPTPFMLPGGGVGPLTALVPGAGGISILNIRRNLPSVSNTWMRWLPRSPTYTLSFLSTAIACGVRNCPGPVPGSPHDLTQSPFLSYLATRELTYPSVM